MFAHMLRCGIYEFILFFFSLNFHENWWMDGHWRNKNMINLERSRERREKKNERKKESMCMWMDWIVKGKCNQFGKFNAREKRTRQKLHEKLLISRKYVIRTRIWPCCYFCYWYCSSIRYWWCCCCCSFFFLYSIRYWRLLCTHRLSLKWMYRENAHTHTHHTMFVRRQHWMIPKRLANEQQQHHYLNGDFGVVWIVFYIYIWSRKHIQNVFIQMSQ